MKASESDLAALAAARLSKQLFSQNVTVQRVVAGVMNYTFKAVCSEKEQYGIRIYPHHRSSVVNFEPDILHNCLEAGVQVTRPIMDSRNDTNAEFQYLVYKWAIGVTLEQRLPAISPGRLAEISENVILSLDRLAKIKVQGFGEMLTADTAAHQSWRGFIDSALHGSKSGSLSWPADVAIMLRAFIENSVSQIHCENPVLTIGDLSPQHIILDDCDQFVGLIDLESVMAAEIPLSIGYCYARYCGTPFWQAISDAWQKVEVSELDTVIRFYAVLRALRLSHYVDVDLPTGQSRVPVEDVLPGFRATLTSLLIGRTNR